MAILVTGGAGYIGSHTCVELLNAGFNIVVVDNLSNSHPEALKRVTELTNKSFPSYFIDLMDRDSLDHVFKEHHIDAVIHFAGLKAVGESVQFPLKYYHDNLMSTTTLCEVMEENNVRQLIFSSSATVYGVPQHVPIDENAPIGAINPYGRTKQVIEQILHDLVQSNPNWSVAILRYFNPVGAHKSGRIGEDPSGVPNNLVPYIAQVAVGKLTEVSVYGKDYDTLDGTGVRDYIHVVDLALGHLKALLKIRATQGVCTYNLGTGQGFSVLEMIQAFQEASGRTIPYRISNRRQGDIATCYAETTKANTELNWIAERGIEEMCRDTWRWQSMNPNGYRELATLAQKG
ncbi:UDP-glucose 4-epimerase GalE [Paenibacillus sp. GSMTC-2017]|uniref:UDP-glucose 4-epimerase GalE n=1 Tax=Paenibacillus sp. GSMTC-2017 TaxID=2794350 RepID=UPI0018D6067F|nr:UDP-glucose 4-epimerase GalE [Paenibacillus sp. GSMTC-2017]MBH5317291.1 UDP-glucose 4-epimerase GalE [Paenibacillus sp. GSMTC-2017]